MKMNTYFKSVALLGLFLLLGLHLQAQTNVTLPAVCNNCGASNSPSTNGTAVVSAYGGAGCTGTGTINGTMTQGVAVSGVTMTLYANVTTVGSYSITAVQDGVTFSGSGIFTATGCQPISLTASGTPVAAGPFTWTTNTTPAGTSTATVAATPAASIAALACNKAVFTPNKMTKNVAYTGTATVAYTGGNGMAYPAVTIASTLVTGLTATLQAGTLANGAGNLTFTITGTPAADGAAEFPITFGGQTCTISLSSCGAYVAPGVWKEFLCHNLGANITTDPHTLTASSWDLMGAHVQWGRRGAVVTSTDSRIDWQTSPNNGFVGFAAAPTATSTNNLAISPWLNLNSPNYSWRMADGTKTTSDPCPPSYRVPTLEEWQGVYSFNISSRSGTWGTNYSSALHFGPDATTKTLTLPANGYRDAVDGRLAGSGNVGFYWSSTSYLDDAVRAYNFSFNSTVVQPGYNNSSNGRTAALSVRCIKE